MPQQQQIGQQRQAQIPGTAQTGEFTRCFVCDTPLVGGIGKYIGDGKWVCNPGSRDCYNTAVEEGIVTNK